MSSLIYLIVLFPYRNLQELFQHIQNQPCGEKGIIPFTETESHLGFLLGKLGVLQMFWVKMHCFKVLFPVEYLGTAFIYNQKCYDKIKQNPLNFRLNIKELYDS